MKLSEYVEFSALELAVLVDKGQVSADEMLTLALEAQQAVDGKINAITNLQEGQARQQIDRGLGTSNLAGVPFLLKDLHTEWAGVVCTSGSRVTPPEAPKHDNFFVSRLKEAGVMPFGMTATPEFGCTVTTEAIAYDNPTRNPWNLDYSAGGSSGGAGAAVAAGIVPVAHATDGGGSIRIPAYCNGLVGLKPSRARTPIGPSVNEGWAGLSIGGVVSRTVEDSAAYLDILAGPSSGDPYSAPHSDGGYLDSCRKGLSRSIKVAVLNSNGASYDVHVQKAIEDARSKLTGLGHTVIDLEVQDIDFQDLGRKLLTIIAANIAVQARRDEQRIGRAVDERDYERNTLRLVELGRNLTAEDYIDAIATNQAAGRKLHSYLAGFDVLMEPTLSLEPCKIGWLDANSDDVATYNKHIASYTMNTGKYNQTGQPSISVPLALSDNGLPIGTMFTGCSGDEKTLLQLAFQLESAYGFNGGEGAKPAVWAGN